MTENILTEKNINLVIDLKCQEQRSDCYMIPWRITNAKIMWDKRVTYQRSLITWSSTYNFEEKKYKE